MNKAEILIIGINSFLGKAIYEFTKSDYIVTGIYNQHKENIPDTIACYHIESISNLEGTLFKHIYLVSSYVPPPCMPEDDQKLVKANLCLPKLITELFPLSRIVFCSSVSVYQNCTATKILSVHDAPSPKSKYALSKLWGECTIANHHSYAILRISSMYGVGMKTGTFMPHIIKHALSAGEIVLKGEGDRLQNYIHVDDVAKIAVKAAAHSENMTVLAVADRSYENREIAEIIFELIPGRIQFFGSDDSDSYVYDNAHTQELLGQIKYKSIKEGIKELIEWTTKKS